MHYVLFATNVYFVLEMAHHCDTCDKEFNREDNYNKHIRVHENELDCDICKKPHNCLEDLLVHIERVHAPRIGYTCDICLRQYSCIEGLVGHIETHHNPNTTGK